MLHVALRNVSGTPVKVDGEDVMPAVQSVLQRMEVFTKKVFCGFVVADVKNDIILFS